MALTVAQKLRIRENESILVLNQPEEYLQSLGKLPPNVRLGNKLKQFSQLHWFVKSKSEVEEDLKRIRKLLKENVLCWIFFPKGSSGIQTDLTRDKGWEPLKELNLQWVNLVSFDKVWSAFAMRMKTEADLLKKVKPNENLLAEYIDPVQKSIRIPDDLSRAFEGHRKESHFFNSLAYSHKKEYIEWIVTAKKAETRASRIRSTIDRLGKQFKNPHVR